MCKIIVTVGPNLAVPQDPLSLASYPLSQEKESRDISIEPLWSWNVS